MNKQRGVTIIEMLVAISITGIFALVFMQVFLAGSESSAFINDISEMSEDADDSLMGFPDMSGIVPQTRMSTNVVSVNASKLNIQISDTVYEYYLSGKTLFRKTIPASTEDTIGTNITNLGFKYYGLSGSTYQEITDTNLISIVTVNITVDNDNQNRTLQLYTCVSMRNKK